MGFCDFIVKYILFIVNLVFVLTGITLLGLGIAVLLRASVVTDFLESVDVTLTPIFTIVVGAIVVFIAFFGCCGAIQQNSCMLISYGIFMIILMILKIALAIVIFVYLEDFSAEIVKNLTQAFVDDPLGFQTVETEFSCCGPFGSRSYSNQLLLPNTCCAVSPCTLLNAFGGCNYVFQNYIDSLGITIAVILLIVAGIELLAAYFSLSLANTVRNKGTR